MRLRTLLKEAAGKKKLRVFDFDDSLVTTRSFIYVTHGNGKTTKMTPGEYAVYTPKADDEFDYSDFQHVREPKEIKWVTDVFRRVVKAAQGTVFILTARAHYKPIREYLKDIGINIGKVYVEALADSNPERKADWIENKVKNEGYNDIYFIDDSIKNIKAVDKRLKPIKGIKYRVQHLKH